MVRFATHAIATTTTTNNTNTNTPRSRHRERRCTGLDNVAEPRELDGSAAPWAGIDDGSLDAVYACNVCHISPYAVTQGLFSGSAAALAEGGVLCVYGPFSVR